MYNRLSDYWSPNKFFKNNDKKTTKKFSLTGIMMRNSLIYWVMEQQDKITKKNDYYDQNINVLNTDVC